MRKLAFLPILGIFSVTMACAQSPGAPAKKGFIISTPPNSKPNRLTKSTRNIDRKIATALDAVKLGNRGIDLAKIEEKLRGLLGKKMVICGLVLRPSGRVEDVTIMESSGSAEADSKAIEFLERIKNYGPYHGSKENLLYQVEMPRLKILPLEPFGNKLFKPAQGEVAPSLRF